MAKSDMQQTVAIIAIVVLGVGFIGALALLGMHGGANYATEYPKAQSNLSYITVTASGVAYGTPDQAQIYLTVNGTGNTTHDAMVNLSATLTTLNQTLLRYTGGNSSNLKTTSFEVYKVYNISTYGASESITVMLQNVKNTDPLLANLSSIPNVYVGAVQTTFSQQATSAMRNTALSNALVNATGQAQVIAGNVQIYVGNVTIDNYAPIYYGLSGTASPNTAPRLVYTGTGTVIETVSASFYHK